MRETTENKGVTFEFGKFILDPHERVFLVDGRAVHLSEKVFDTLHLLVQNNGKLLTKDEMMASIWEESFVEEGNLAKSVSRLRKILNTGGVEMIETLPRRGYRFKADVRRVDADTDLLVHRQLRIKLTQNPAQSEASGSAFDTSPDVIKSIAILPFQPLDPTETDEIFGLGLTDALITQMNRGGHLQVRPTSSILKFNISDRDPIVAARELDAGAILDGRFQRVGSKLRLTVQLLRTSDGASLWADSFNAEVDDIFTVQDVIGERVVRALTAKMSSQARFEPAKRDTDNIDAYQEYLKGRYFWTKRNAESYDEALKCYEKAIEIDPRYALAYAGLADIYNLLPYYDGFAPQDYFPKAKLAALKALELDENLAEAHAALGVVVLDYDWNWSGAELAFRRALNLDPNFSTGYELLGVYLCRVGRVSEAIKVLTKAYELDPLSPINATWLAEVFRYCGQPEAAVALHEKTVADFPDFYLAHYHLAFAYLDLGRFTEAAVQCEKAVSLSGANSLTLSLQGVLQATDGNDAGARETLDRLIKMKTEKYISSVNIASVYAASGNEKDAMFWLEAARQERDPNLTWIRFDKEFEFLRSNSGFQTVLLDVGLAETELQLSGLPNRTYRTKRLFPALAAAILVVLAAAIGGYYYWKQATPIVSAAPYEPVHLTHDPAAENYPRWAKDGSIRFLRTGSDKRTAMMMMNSDGTDQREAKPFGSFSHGVWSPDETKVLFFKEGDKTSIYLANADGSNEFALPFSAGSFDWSHDGKRIVYQTRINADDSDIFVYTLETGKSEDVSKNPSFDADPSFSPDGKQIAFASLRDGNAEIYLMNSDGTDVRRLTNHPAWESHPLFSPDGTQIAFNADRENDSGNTFLMNLDGSGVRRLTNWKSGDYVVPGGWSADGTQIVFSSEREGGDDVFVTSAEVFHPHKLAGEDRNVKFPSYSPDGRLVLYAAEMGDNGGELRTFNVETRVETVLSKTTIADTAPSFSPDGEQIVFQDRIGSNAEICLIKADGTGLVNLTNNPSRDADPSFSPDGTKIVFATNRDGNYGIYSLYLMNPDGSEQRQFYSTRAGMSVTPGWSPDGREIVFANDKEGGRVGNFEIYKIGVDGSSTEKRLTFRPRGDGNPSVSPDGRRIAFASDATGNGEIYVMNFDGSGPLRITRNSADDTYPRWSPDGKRLLFTSNRDGKYAIYEVEI
ncbi:MAG: tetratricopeptide repeat protein [Acidobacteriota bacterium]